MADLSLRAESVPAIPHFPSDYPASLPFTERQRVLAANAERLASMPVPPPIIDEIIAMLDALDGDGDAELNGDEQEDAEGLTTHCSFNVL